MLTEGHIFTIKTKDPQNVSDIQSLSTGVIISGLNVLKDNIKVGDLAFVVFGGDNPPWDTGLVALAKISKKPYDEGYDPSKRKNFRVKIDIVTYFEHILRADLVTYPDTFDIIGIGPITKWEPNQAISAVPRNKAIALLHALCDLRPDIKPSVQSLLGADFSDVEREITRYTVGASQLGTPQEVKLKSNLKEDFEHWLKNIYRRKDNGQPLTSVDSYVDALWHLTNADKYPGQYDKKSATYWYNMYHFLYGVDGPSVYEFSTETEVRSRFGAVLLALNDGIPEDVDVNNFNQVRAWGQQPNVKRSGWIKSAFARYFEFLQWREEQQKKNGETKAVATDVLTVALKMFAEKRKEEEWCSDNTDGDTTKPHAGYVANKQLRVLSNTSADIDKLNGDGANNIKAWFKNYWNVADGKSWLEGLSDADLSGFGPYIAYLLQPGNQAVAKPAKFSNALEAAVKAVIKPEETGLYDERVNETLKFLGLIGFDWNENFDADDLGEAVNAQRVIKRRLKDMGLKRIQESPTADDGIVPDYLTVNEFLWFVNKNLNAIEKQVLEGKMVAAKHEAISSTEKTRKPKCDMSSHDDVLLLRLRAALRTKPFAILAGHSGTGKSRMVRQLAYMTCNDAALRKDEKGNPAKDPGNFCMVQVKPNWHDSGDLLGYYSELGKRYRASDFVKFIVKAYAYPDTPFFVCLDEMNLAPVEQYFAEYLSAIESRKIQKVKVLKGNPLAEADDETVVSDELIPRSAYVEGEEANRVIHYDWLGCELKESEHWIANYGLTIPRNLFVVGTVNMDESTNQFSRKVLDRAMTLEMTDADFKSFGKKGLEPSYDNYMGDDAVADLLAGKIQAEKLEDHQIRNLNALKTVLGATSFAVAYRFANEYALYETSLKETQTKTDTTSVPTPAAGAPAPAPAVNVAQAAASATPPADGGTAAAAPAEAVPAIPAKPLAFDDMILMKVLPRISGEDVVVRRIFFGENGKFSDPKPGSLLELVQKGGTDTESVRKIKAIDERGGAYLSFWP